MMNAIANAISVAYRRTAINYVRRCTPPADIFPEPSRRLLSELNAALPSGLRTGCALRLNRRPRSSRTSAPGAMGAWVTPRREPDAGVLNATQTLQAAVPVPRIVGRRRITSAGRPRFGYRGLLGSGHQPRKLRYGSVGRTELGASAAPQKPHNSATWRLIPTDETAHSGTLLMRVKGTEASRPAAPTRVSWAVGIFPR
jgi:hypothetical protein